MKRKISNWFKFNILPILINYYLKFIFFTSKIIVINEKYYNSVENKNIVYSIWHGEQMPIVYKHKNQDIISLVSPSRDGEIQHLTLKLLGYETIRGSSNKSPVRSFIRMIKIAKQTQKNFAFAVDGPKGPIYKVKPGVIQFAYKTGYYILPISSNVKYKIVLKSWDKAIIPLPFNKIFIFYSKPFKVINVDSDLDKLNQIMNKATQKCSRLRD